MPDAVKEQERMKHATLHDFLRAVVVPEMQIKLRQGFGRAIRTETDTCVVAILDERAGKNRRYFRDVLTALPEVPVTHSLKDVERFIRAVKPEGYFLEARHEQHQNRTAIPDRPGYPGTDVFSWPCQRPGGRDHPAAGSREIPPGNCSGIVMDIPAQVW
mgnify:FL=1